MKRKVEISIGIGVLFLGILLFMVMKNRPEEQVVKIGEQLHNVKVTTQEVHLSSIPYRILATGTLEAKEKIELFSEVQGVLKRSGTLFKEGNLFKRGQTILYIDAHEFKAQLKSNKSLLISQIAAMLPDLEVEYPEAAVTWEAYLKSFTEEEPLPTLPEFTSEAERLFVTGRNIVQTYYNVLNLQERLSKYFIKAPFTGIVSEANVNVGALVRSGQKLGEFLDSSVFELRLSLPASENDFLQVGQHVELKTLYATKEWIGTVARISPVIDQNTQSIHVFVSLRDEGLRDGQYLSASIIGKGIPNVFMVSNELLTINNEVFVVENNELALKHVIPINYVGDSIIVKGLKQGQLLVTDRIANAYPGMKVTTEKQ